MSIFLQHLDVSGSEVGIQVERVGLGGFMFDSLVHDNLAGIVIAEPGGQVYASNNTVVNNTDAGFMIDGPVQAVGVHNNIVASNGEVGIAVVDDPDGLTMLGHNDVWDNPVDYDGVLPGLDDISQDPSFIDAGAGDYRLQAGSPAIDAGWDPFGAGQMFYSTDLDGNPRLVDGDCDGTATEDMGAYEYVPANCPPALSVDDATVTVLEGEIAANGGAVSDPNGDPITLSASAGTVVDDLDGTWSWSYDTTGVAAGTHPVDITADDGQGGVSTVSFELVVEPDADGDGVPDGIDNAPNDYNPDQSDLDGDGVGDVADACPTDASNTCDPAASVSTYMYADTGGTLSTADGRASVTIPPDALQQDSSIVIADSSGGDTNFELTTNMGKVLGVFAFDLLPSQDFNLPVVVTFSWDDADDNGREDNSNAKEDNFMIVKDGTVYTGKCKADAGCDAVANTFTFQVESWSLFTLAHTHAPEVAAIDVPIDPVDISQAVDVSGAFSDLYDDDSHSAVWDWGDSTTSAGEVDHESNTVSGSHVYGEAGVYTVKLIVSDAFPDNSGQAVSEFIIVYDPAGGFVTGGGWIDSPAGAYVPDPTAAGKATFGFVSKYKKGATVPTGNTRFQFKAGDLNFHSDSYDWLVVTGSDYAKFKGIGTINGTGEFKFKIWAGDDSPDTFRIKIWTEDDAEVETVVYDNGMDQAIGGGSIKVHTK